MEPRIQYAKTSDGVSIAFTVIGSGTEALVSASSTWGDLQMYKAVRLYRAYFDMLADRGRRVVLYDIRNMGSSEHRDRDYSDRGRLTDLEAVVDHIGLDRFDLYGFLLGSHTATAYAVAHPDRVERLVLSQPYARGTDFYTAVPEMAMVTRMEPSTPEEEEISSLSSASIITGFTDPGLAAEVSSATSSSMSASELTAFVEATRQGDINGLLPQISVPTLVVFTHSFLPAILPFTREVARLVPGAEFIETGERGEIISGGVPEVIDTFLRGEEATPPPEAPQPSTFRTVLFTDIVGHTEMMSRLGDAKGRDVLRDHERITRGALTEHGGSEVKTMGDGFMASFGSVTKAVECAIGLQRAFAERESDEPLSMRVGINAGEPIEEDGDLFGATVILASRIAAKAEGGEILVADTIRGLCSGKGFLFADRGEFVAKGFEDPVRLFEVSWRDE
jgi:class 3 adenylate cyclase